LDPFVFFAVLAAAALHAGWNAIVKVRLDRFLSIIVLGLAQGVVSLLLLPFFPLPALPAWPYIAASAVLHTGYKLFLIRTYSAGDLGQIYPLARGTAPLLIAGIGVGVLGEEISVTTMIGIATAMAGIWLMAARGGNTLAALGRNAAGYAIGTSLFIAAYTLVDGLGGRLSNSPSAYTLWMFALDGCLNLAVALGLRGVTVFEAARLEWKSGLVAGVLSLAAYWIVIWAMTLAPIAAVAALRETSILFAALISVVLLKEPLTAWRAAAACLIVAGVVAIRLG
jgi:drug/metabolite transporter (DMT)-like permease